MKGLLPLTRITSSLSLFGILLCTHMCFMLAHFLPPDSKDVMNTVYFFFFVGSALGAVLCPLFLPVPGGKNKPLLMSIGFIVSLIAIECMFRSLGFPLWLGSAALRSIMAVPEGIISTLCYGLFYLTWLRPAADGRANSTGKFCSLALGAILLGPVLVRYYSVPLIEAGLAAEDPLKGAEFLFNGIKYCMIVLGLSAAASVFLMRNTAGAFAPPKGEPGEDVPVNGVAVNGAPAVPAVKTDWPVILRLIGLASVFTILNGVIDMRALPLYSDNAIFHPNYLMVTAAVLVLGYLAGRSTSRFIRRFLPPAIILFILFACLPLFADQPQFNMIIGTLIAIAHYTVWVVFTTAVVELYAGVFWFYGSTIVIFFSVAFAFLAPVIDPFVPEGTEYQVLFIVIAAVLFMLLAFRWLFFPKLIQSTARKEPFSASILEISNLEDIFRERGLSKREIEVANLLVKEGLGKQKIGERLFITPGTAKTHISNIYQKFGVNNRAEFMALFVKGDKD